MVVTARSVTLHCDYLEAAPSVLQLQHQPAHRTRATRGITHQITKKSPGMRSTTVPASCIIQITVCMRPLDRIVPTIHMDDLYLRMTRRNFDDQTPITRMDTMFSKVRIRARGIQDVGVIITAHVHILLRRAPTVHHTVNIHIRHTAAGRSFN